MRNTIKIEQVDKSFGNKKAVEGLSFVGKSGELTMLLGPNGAGKSTAIQMMSTLVVPDSGKITVCGYDTVSQRRKVRAGIGVVFQNPVLDRSLTVEENLYLRGSFYGKRSRYKEVFEVTGIVEILKEKYGNLSGGQKRRCDIARALMTNPKVLFLDEPSAGLDPQIRKSLLKTVKRIKDEMGITVLISTHYLDETSVADYIVIMKSGRAIAQGTPKGLIEKFAEKRVEMFGVGEKISLKVKNADEALQILRSCRGKYDTFRMTEGSMEDVYESVLNCRRGNTQESKKGKNSF